MRILRQLSEAMGVSGAESEVRRVILDLVEGHVDEVHTDTLGNLLVFKKGTSRSKNKLTVLIDAHMDEVGFMVTGYTSDGMLKVKSVGGLDDRILLGKRVLVGEKQIPGVIGAKPVHLLDSSAREKVVKLDAMRVDIGQTKKEQAKSKAPLGTRIGFESEFMDLGRRVQVKRSTTGWAAPCWCTCCKAILSPSICGGRSWCRRKWVCAGRRWQLTV